MHIIICKLSIYVLHKKMDAIYSLMKRILAIYIMKNFANPTFTRDNDSFLIVLIIIFGFYSLRTYEKWEQTIVY